MVARDVVVNIARLDLSSILSVANAIFFLFYPRSVWTKKGDFFVLHGNRNVLEKAAIIYG
jgi:hypothetical protein